MSAEVNGKDSNISVKTAVIPCAGLGTRMLPLTKVVAKELLPLGSKPLIEHAMAELGEAGIEKVIIVTRDGKQMLERHLTENYPFPERAHVPSPIPHSVKSLIFVKQEDPRGLGDALKRSLPYLDGSPFVLLLPDQFLIGLPRATAQLIKSYSGQDSLSSLVNIPKAEIEYFAGCRGAEIEGEGPCYHLKSLLGETGVPGLSDGRFTVRGFGRMILKPEFLETIEDEPEEQEFSLAITRYISEGRHDALLLDGRPIDVGTRVSYQYFWKIWESLLSSDA